MLFFLTERGLVDVLFFFSGGILSWKQKEMFGSVEIRWEGRGISIGILMFVAALDPTCAIDFRPKRSSAAVFGASVVILDTATWAFW